MRALDSWKAFHSIRWRLLTSSLLVVGVPLVAFTIILGQELWRFYLQQLEQQLRSTAWLVAESIIPQMLQDDEEGLADVLERWDRHTGIRLIVIDERGIIRATTAGSASIIVGQPIDDQLAPGLRSSLSGLANSLTWKSPQRDYEETMYVNVPILSEGRLLGAVRVSYSLGQVLQRVDQIRAALLAGVIIYALLVAALKVALASSIARPVEALNRSARRLAAGDLDHRVPVEGTQEVEQLAIALNQMTERLSALEGLRRRYVSDVSHELRAPLAAIRGMAETVARHGEQDPELVERYVPRIISQTDRLARLATQLLDLAQIESGNPKHNLTRVQLAEVVDEAVQTARQSRPDKNFELEVNLEPDLPVVEADRDRLVQMLLNLVDNAMRHTESGGRIQVGGRSTADRVVLTVGDQGPGIPPEHLPHLFERFYRVDSARSERQGGAGLGLSIVEQIVRVQGGNIQVRSKVGEGTVFQVELPLNGALEEAPAVAPKPQAPADLAT